MGFPALCLWQPLPIFFFIESILSARIDFHLHSSGHSLQSLSWPIGLDSSALAVSKDAIIKRPFTSLRILMVSAGRRKGKDSMDVTWKVIGRSSMPASDTVDAELHWKL